MPELSLEAFVKVRDDISTSQSFVTGLVKNDASSPAVTAGDAISADVTVFMFDEAGQSTTLEFFRAIDAIDPGHSWEHVWTIQGAVQGAGLKVRDSAGAVLASASFTM